MVCLNRNLAPPLLHTNKYVQSLVHSWLSPIYTPCRRPQEWAPSKRPKQHRPSCPATVQAELHAPVDRLQPALAARDHVHQLSVPRETSALRSLTIGPRGTHNLSLLQGVQAHLVWGGAWILNPLRKVIFMVVSPSCVVPFMTSIQVKPLSIIDEESLLTSLKAGPAGGCLNQVCRPPDLPPQLDAAVAPHVPQLRDLREGLRVEKAVGGCRKCLGQNKPKLVARH